MHLNINLGVEKKWFAYQAEAYKKLRFICSFHDEIMMFRANAEFIRASSVIMTIGSEILKMYPWNMENKKEED